MMNYSNDDKTTDDTHSGRSLQKDLNFKTSKVCNNAACVGVARLDNGDVAVQDTKNASAKPLIFTHAEWEAFVAGVKNGEFEINSL